MSLPIEPFPFNALENFPKSVSADTTSFIPHVILVDARNALAARIKLFFTGFQFPCLIFDFSASSTLNFRLHAPWYACRDNS